MATVKNFGLAGVSADVQWGKGGGRFTYSAGDFSVRNAADDDYVQLNIPLVPTEDEHAASKQYVDSVATGLDVKLSVRAITLSVADLTGFSYVNGSDDNSSATPLVWTGAGSAVFDGITIADGDRVVIKNAADAKGNGVFTFDDGFGFRRSYDADNTPNNEVSGGLFTFVEEGSYADTGWVLSSPQGIAVLGTDSLVFSQFSGSSAFTGGNGIDISASTISADVDEVTITNTGGGGDQLAVRSTGTAGQVLLSNGTPGDDAVWGALNLDNSSATTGTLGINRGGTNLASIADRSILVTTGADVVVALTVTPNSNDQLLMWDDSADDFVFVNTSTVGTSYGQIAGDSGTATAVGSAELITFGGTGITVTATDSGTEDADTVAFDLTLADLSAGVATLALADIIAVNDSSDGATVAAQHYTFQDVVDDLNIPNSIASNGIIAKTGANTYTNRTITASVASGEQGITVTNGDGVSGDPTVGLDLSTLTYDSTSALTDEIIVYNGSDNVRTSIQDLYASTALVFVSVTGDSGVAIADNATDTLQLEGATNGGITTVATDGPELVTFAITLTDLADGSGGTVLLTHELALNAVGDAFTASAQKFSFTDVVQDLNIPNAISSDGFVVRTSDDNYASRTITADVDPGYEGISVQDGDGVAANPQVGLYFDSLTFQTSVLGTDEVIIFNGSNNVRTTISNIVAGGTVSWTQIDGDSGTATADSSSDAIDMKGQSGTTGGAGGILVTAAEGTPETVYFDLDINNVAATTPTVLTSDAILLDDGGVTTRVAWSTVLTSLDIVDSAGLGNGFLVKTGDDNYVSSTLTADTDAGYEGISVQNGAGATDPEIGLDINSLTQDTVIEGTNFLVVFNGSNNVKVAIDDLLEDVNANEISQGDSSVTVTDTGTGSVTTTVDSTLISTVTTAGVTMNSGDILNTSGSETDPSYSFSANEESGMYFDGTGVCITDDGTDVACFDGISTGVNAFLFSNGATGDGIQMEAVGDDTNIDINIVPKGTGDVVIGDGAGGDATITTDAGDALTLSTGDNSGGAAGDITIDAGDSTSGAGGNVVIKPGDGSTTDGTVCINDFANNEVTCFEGVASAVNYFTVTNAATGAGPQIQATGDTNLDIRFLPAGTGALSVTGTSDYENNVTDDDDIPNKKYVDDAVSAATSGSNAVQTVEWTVDLTSATTQAATDAIPAGARVLRVYFNIGTASDAATTVAIESFGGAETLQSTVENDPETSGLYQSDLFVATTAGVPQAVVTTAGSIGTATALVEFRTS